MLLEPLKLLFQLTHVVPPEMLESFILDNFTYLGIIDLLTF